MIEEKSLDVFAAKLAQLRELIPEVLTEGKIDFKRLRDVLGDEVSFNKEHYELSWAGKAEARAQIQKATSATLIPDDSGIVADGCGNIFIEGENLEVLHVLQRSYFGKIKMIYIDPPYNTGNDSFVYPDDYSERQDEYKKRAGITDKNGFLNKQDLWKKNSKESGQFHSVWLSMMYPRLYLARNLLREDGVIFISIDDNEQANLKLLCDEIFGAENFLTIITLKVRYEGKTLVEDMDFQKLVEYVLVYAKNLNQVKLQKPENDYSFDKFEWHIEETGEPEKIELGGKIVEIFNQQNYKISRIEPSFSGLKEIWATGKILDGNSSGRFFRDYIIGRNELDELGTLYKVYGIGEDELPYRYFTGRKKQTATKGKYYQGIPKSVLNNLDNSKRDQPIITFFDLADNFGNCRHEGGVDFRSGKKPLALLRKLFEIIEINNDDIILDFFSGSGTTAHAVLDLNEQDGGSRQFICVQLPEPLEENSEAYKAGYKTIADICKARITKVIEKIQAERDNKKQTDLIPETSKQVLGFKSFKLAPSNFKQWRGDIDENELLTQLELFKDSEQAYSENYAMLIELLLKAGFPLTANVEINTVAGQELYNVDSGKVLFFFDDYNDTVKDFIFKLKPNSVVCLNRVFKNNDQALTNFQLSLKDAGIELQII